MKTIAETFDEHWRSAPGPLETPCHIWQRRISNGYGKTGDAWAHRVSWERIRDASAKGRTCKGPRHWTRQAPSSIARGERHGRSKLNAIDIERVRDMRRLGCKQLSIALWLGISRPLVSLIARGKRWVHT